MPPRFELVRMGLDDPHDLHQLAPIVSRASLELGTVQPELRVATVALDVDMWRLTSVAGAEPKGVASLVVKRWHGRDRRHRCLSAAYHPICERGA